jgi:hypothetical protein
MTHTPDDTAKQEADRKNRRTDEEKLLDKLAAMKRHADSCAAIGNEAEAQAFVDRLQQMLLDHDLQMSDLEFDEMDRDQPIDQVWLNYTAHGIPNKKTRTEWMERLASMIARANFCRIIVVSKTSNVWLVGRPEHRAVAEYMIVTLTRAVIDISKKAHMQYVWEVYKRDRNTHAARGFKESFVTGFLFRLFQRLEERKSAAGSSTETGLMRINREDAAVEAEMAKKRETKETKKAHGLRLADPSNREGVKRGKAAAENVNLDGRAVGTSVGRKELV